MEIYDDMFTFTFLPLILMQLEIIAHVQIKCE